MIRYSDVLEKIQGHKALVQILAAPLSNQQAIEKMVKQLASPATFRPIKAIDENTIDRTRRYNPKTRQWEDKNRSGQRGRNKETEFTKKQSVSLLPADGKMHLYQPPNISDTVGFIYDLELCNLKDEKYIFQQDECTNSKFWLKTKGLAEEQHKVSKSISLQQLIDEMESERKKANIPVYNDITAALAKKALMGVFSRKDTLFDRLNALKQCNYIKEKLGKEVPVLIITPEKGIKEYDLEQQKNDLKALESLDENNPAKLLMSEKNDIVSKKFSGEEKKEFSDTFNTTLPNVLKTYIAKYIHIAELLEIIDSKKHSDEFNKELVKCYITKFRSEIRNAILNDVDGFFNDTKNINSIPDFIVGAAILYSYYHQSPEEAQKKALNILCSSDTSVARLKILTKCMPLININGEKKQIGTHSYTRSEFVSTGKKEINHSSSSSYYKSSGSSSYFSGSGSSRSSNYYGGSNSSRYYESGYYKKFTCEDPIYIRQWTPLLNVVLLNNAELMQIIVNKHKQNMDVILGGLLDLMSEAKQCTSLKDKAYQDNNIKEVYFNMLSLLEKTNYKPLRLDNKQRETIELDLLYIKITDTNKNDFIKNRGNRHRFKKMINFNDKTFVNSMLGLDSKEQKMLLCQANNTVFRYLQEGNINKFFNAQKEFLIVDLHQLSKKGDRENILATKLTQHIDRDLSMSASNNRQIHKDSFKQKILQYNSEKKADAKLNNALTIIGNIILAVTVIGIIGKALFWLLAEPENTPFIQLEEPVCLDEQKWSTAAFGNN